MRIPRFVQIVLRYAGTLAAVGALTAVMWAVQEDLLPGAIALMYLLVVFLAALMWGMGPAFAGAALASVTFDYFFTPPAWSLTGFKTITESVMYVVFFVVTILTSRLATDARRQAEGARLRAREARILYELERALAETANVDEDLAVTAQQLVTAFEVESCSALVPDDRGHLRVSARAPHGASVTLGPGEEAAAVRVARENVPGTHGANLLVPFPMGPERTGILRIGPRRGRALSSGEQQLIRTFVNAASAAIHRHQLHDAITRADILQQSDQLKSALMSSVSHDLRTPLAAIKAAITTLQDGAWKPDDQRDLLGAANDEVDRLTRLIGNLLDVSRIEAGALRPDRQWYEIGELIRDAARRVDGRVDRAIAVAIPDDLPPVSVDYVQIQQVVTNLIENAARYAPAGTGVRIEAVRHSGELVIRVRDGGPGIPAAEAERIFSKFYRIGGQPGGTGLGLAICRGLVEAHGGRIWVDNPGQPGAVFAFTLPIGASPETGEIPA